MEESYPMTSGNGSSSYAKNSSRQKVVIESVMELLVTAILENLDIKQVSRATKSFRIADFGCSTSSNTFIAMNIIVETVVQKFQTEEKFDLPEFEVYFNDVISNDFNTLFSNFPLDKNYFIAAVPGSFHKRLFPVGSLSLGFSSTALHWLSKIPNELIDRNSPAFNKGRIHYLNAPEVVLKAYRDQHAKDIESFLSARAKELIPGGLLTLTIPGRCEGSAIENFATELIFQHFQSTLLHIAKEGIISYDTLDTFNLPIYIPTCKEFKTIIQKVGHFTIARLHLHPLPLALCEHLSTKECRSVFENLIKNHFGDEIIEEVFNRYDQDIASIPSSGSNIKVLYFIFVVLKRI